MIVSNVSNTKNKLSELLQKVQQGEEVTIVDRNKPVARIVSVNVEREGSLFARLVAEGIVSRPINPDRYIPNQIESFEGVSLLDTLLAEREEDRI